MRHKYSSPGVGGTKYEGVSEAIVTQTELARPPLNYNSVINASLVLSRRENRNASVGRSSRD